MQTQYNPSSALHAGEASHEHFMRASLVQEVEMASAGSSIEQPLEEVTAKIRAIEQRLDDSISQDEKLLWLARLNMLQEKELLLMKQQAGAAGWHQGPSYCLTDAAAAAVTCNCSAAEKASILNRVSVVLSSQQG